MESRGAGHTLTFLRELRKQMFVLETVSPEEYVDKKAAIETAIKQTWNSNEELFR